MKKHSKHIYALALIFFVAHGVYSAHENSVTADEYVHLPAAISALKTGDPQMDHRGSPPLGRALLALPALFNGSKIDTTTSAWKNGEIYPFSWEFLRDNFRRYHSVFFLPRLMGVLFGVALIIAIAMTASRIFGAGAGPVAALLAATSPEFLAHAPLVATDFVGAGFFLPPSSCSPPRLKTRRQNFRSSPE